MDGKGSGAGMDCHDCVISIEDMSFRYEGVDVFEGFNFRVLQRDFVGVAGSNGAGKTTLLKLIVGLLKPQKGRILLFGRPVQEFRDWERIGYVPQRLALNPLFPATVREVVRSGLFSRKKMFRRLTAEDHRKCEEAMQALGIADLADRRIGKLSGGQQQRVFLARSLVNNPDLLILDEPMNGIDAETQEAFFHMLNHLHQRHNITFLMVSHDIDLLRTHLGGEPKMRFGKLNFYIRHSHELEDCGEENLTHTLRDWRGRREPQARAH